MRVSENLFLLSFILLLFILYVIGLFFGVASMDDAILGEQAYWVSQLGIVQSKLFSGMDQGWEIRQFHFHKLFIFTGALWLKIFGWSLINLKTISLLFSLLSGLLFFKITRKQFLLNHKYACLAIIFLFVNTSIYFFSHIYRPEIMVMLIGLISFYFLNDFIQNSKNGSLILSGIFSGLAAFSHLNGLIFIFAGAIALLLTGRYKQVFIFGILGSLTTLLYFIDIHSMSDLLQLKAQFFADPNLEKEDTNILTPIFKILNEHKRLFRSPREITLFGFYILAIALNFKYLIKNHLFVLVYSLACIIGLAGLAHGITTKYSIIYFPSVILIVVLGLKNVFDNNSQIVKSTFKVMTVVYIGLHMFYNVGLLIDSDSVMKRNNRVVEHIESGDKILATESMIFDYLENHDMISFLGFRYKEFNYKFRAESEVKIDDILEFAKDWNRDLIVVDKRLEDERILNIFARQEFKVGKEFNGFIVIENSDDFLILRKTKNT